VGRPFFSIRVGNRASFESKLRKFAPPESSRINIRRGFFTASRLLF
jgi:hypothetical protein